MAEADKKTIGNGKAGPGRPKGVPNKATAAVKDMILAALDRKGGVDYLVEQADANPVAFMSLLGKVMPTQIEGAGKDGAHLHEIVYRVVNANG